MAKSSGKATKNVTKAVKGAAVVRPVYKSSGIRQSKTTPSGNHIIVTRYPEIGIMSLYVRKSKSTNCAFLNPHLKLNTSTGGSLFEAANIFSDYVRRKTPTSNTPMPQDPKNPDYPFVQFVCILEKSEDCTPEMAKEWGEHVAKTFTEFTPQCAEGYSYALPRFTYVADLTPEENVPLYHDFLDADVLGIMREIYRKESFSNEDLAGNPDIVKMFFGDRDDAKDLILTYVETDGDGEPELVN